MTLTIGGLRDCTVARADELAVRALLSQPLEQMQHLPRAAVKMPAGFDMEDFQADAPRTTARMICSFSWPA